MIGLMQQLYSIARFVVYTRFPTVASKGFEKNSDLCTKHYPLEYVKMCSRVCIYISLRSIKTLDPMAKKESEKSNLHASRSVEISKTFSSIV